ncbi:putative late blight resistance protein homolog R1A-3 [Salvia hispanica]|uniref:putative late blight resistance protein homolog R1A-3 n=1 Tax=Salvia hispanica TaxID=49212 RepID=UPI002008F86C|nr:putative late blight resistance protein homolog R1A-3 [Salvia hispanica]
MGGIGKTTLARDLYVHSIVGHHFDVRGWVNVSQEYNVSDMLSQALSCLGGLFDNKTDDQLGEELHKSLFGQRYLIILDDVWSVEAWEKIQFFFPRNDNGSRIVVTTRQQELVDYFGSSSLVVEFLGYVNSWKLFCDVTFAQPDCPPELEKMAKEIVRKCRGLPLAICVIWGLLGKSPMMQEYWEKIAKDKSLVMEYSEDHSINVSNLIRLWVAEGFIKPTRNQSLEQVAEGYIKDLIDRNLLLVGDLEKNKKIARCFLHDLVRELCIRTAEKENFYWFQRDIVGRRQHFIYEERTRGFYRQREAPLKSRLSRVLVDDHDSCVLPSFQQGNMRYISLKYFTCGMPISLSIPRSISLCWSLQTLIVEKWLTEIESSEIWKMWQLRHIEIPLMNLSHPPCGDIFVLHNLQTLKRVKNFIFTEEVCARIPNIREMGIVYSFNEQVGLSWGKFHLENVGRLNKLESLRFHLLGKVYVGDPFDNLKLPNSLTELVLGNCKIASSNMAILSLLPHLQLLQLEDLAFGTEWNLVKEEFRSLKHLVFLNCFELTNWIADKSSFPVLETLWLWAVHKLDEIPCSIGEIPTLEEIRVVFCSESAIKMLKEQENLGNQALQLQILFEHGTWREKIKERFASQNIHIF